MPAHSRPRRKILYRGAILALSSAMLAAALCATPPAAASAAAADDSSNKTILTLARAIELAMANDEMLRQAHQAVVGADAQVVQARSAALPHLSLSGQYGRNILKPSFFLPEEFRSSPDAPAKVEMGEDNDFTGAASVTQVLWAAGRVSAGLIAAREYLSSFRYREALARDYARFSVQEAYYSVLLAGEYLAITRKAMDTASEALRVARVGFEQGAVSRFDLLRAEVEAANREAPLVKAQSDLEQAFLVLKRRCGLEAAAQIVLADSLSAVPPAASSDELVARALRESPEIRALAHYAGAGKQLLRIAKAERYPLLQLTAYYGIQTQWSEGFIPESELIAKTAAVQVGISIPIFDGLNAKGKIGKAAAELRAAELELDRVTRDKELAVRQSLLNLESALTAYRGRIEAVALAEEAHRLALVRLENGLATPLERLDAELAMTTARAQLVEALYQCSIANAYLELTIGGDGAAVAAESSKETTHE